MNRGDLQQLADARVEDAEALLNADRWSAAYYLLGYAIECALKACAARQFREHEVPDKTIVNHFYTHKLDLFLNISGAKAAFWRLKPRLVTCIQRLPILTLEYCHG